MTKQNYCGDDLVIEFQNGNRRAFNKIYDQLHDFIKKCVSKELFGYMTNIHKELALKETEDIIQNAWSELFLTFGNKNKFTPRKECSTRTWVYGQIIIQCKRWKYQMKRKGLIQLVSDEKIQSAIEKVQKTENVNTEDQILLRSGMNNWMEACLNDQEILILKLYFWEEYTFEEIALRLNLKSRKRVHEKYLKARKKLEKYLLKNKII
ncbi:RNA polymerase sigma-70 domain protein [Candidatus Magnetomorum sp. HK-1]|nr:RNA polymerase sigma-70 domain protein [Candidatus Magnetomorum sp. HK-1]